MTAVPFTLEQAAKLAEFDAAPQLAESSPMTRAMLALAEELDGSANRCSDVVARISLRDAADRTRTTLATVLAADPEPRDAVIERMARAMFGEAADPAAADHYRRLAAVALDAIEGGQ